MRTRAIEEDHQQSKPGATLISFLKTYNTLIASAAGFYLVYLYTKYSGIGISPDSIMYTSAARNLNANGTLLTFNNTYITDFPVVYPFFLGTVLFITHIDPIAAAPVIDGVLFAAVIFFSGLIAQRFSPSSWLYKWLMLIAIVSSPALLLVYTYLWSETLFILLILIFIFSARQYLVKHTIAWLIIFALLASLSTVTRYAGVAVIGTGGLLMLLDRALPVGKKILHIVIYGFFSISMLVLNLVRNVMVTGRSTGPREASLTPFVKNIYYTGTVLCDWACLSEKSYPYATLIASLLFLALIAIMIYNFVKRNIHSYENLAVTFTLVYGLFIIISSTLSRYERINTRLLTPFFITLLFSCTYWAIGFVKTRSFSVRLIITPVLVLLMLGFCYKQYQEDWQRYDDENDYGIPGYTDDSWNKSQFAAYLKKDTTIFKPGIPVYSDANDALYFTSGMYVKLLPHRYFAADIQKFYKLKRFYLVWFNDMDNPELISLKDIENVKQLIKLKEFPEGAIYLFEDRD